MLYGGSRTRCRGLKRILCLFLKELIGVFGGGGLLDRPRKNVLSTT